MPMKSWACRPLDGRSMADYQLFRGERRLGDLTRIDADFPWWSGIFEPTPAFEEVRPLFDREREQLEADAIEEWGQVWDAIAAPGLRLEPTDGRGPITEFLVHIDGQNAWWRY